MTRMLWKILLLMATLFILGSCSLFNGESSSGDEEIVAESELNDSSEELSDGSDILDSENEMISEADELAGETIDEDLGSSNEAESSDDFVVDSGDSEEVDATAEAVSEFDFEDEFNSAEIGQDKTFEISQTDELQVDQGLAADELSASDDQIADEFTSVLDDEPSEPIVDTPAMSPANSTARNSITNLAYKAFENGGTVVIETQEPSVFRTIEQPDLNQLIIEVENVFLPERFKRPYITKDFKQDIAAINAYATDNGSARFVVQLKRPISPVVQEEGNAILVMTNENSSVATSVANNSVSADVMGEISESSASGLDNPSSSTAQESIGLSASPSVRENQLDRLEEKTGLSLNSSFMGEKISLEFTDTDVRTIIEVIADKSGVNLIMDKEVNGKTSIRLRNVPWDQALVVTLRSQGLGYVKQGNVLRIAKQETLSKEAQAVSNQIKSEKEAQLLASGIKVKYIPVSYAAVNDLSAKLKEFTSEKGKIAFDDRTSSLVITDYGEYIERIESLVKALDTPPMQVEIESKLVEAREEFTQETGINWAMNAENDLGGGRTARSNVRMGQNSANNNGFSLDLSVGTFDIFGDLTAALSLFERQDKIKVLSQPRITTMNKVKAEIEQVTQIPIRQTVITPGAPAQITFTFMPLTLGLSVTPQITFKGDVILDVELKREFAGVENDDGTRELNTRRAKTTTMIPNGKTAVIGGIYQLDDSDVDAGLPWLKDIPLLGTLFKSSSQTKSKNELLLFLKPKILKEIHSNFDTIVSKGQSTEAVEAISVDQGADTNTSDSFLEQEIDNGTSAEDFDLLQEE